jgi:hypothetical protein
MIDMTNFEHPHNSMLPDFVMPHDGTQAEIAEREP